MKKMCNSKITFGKPYSFSKHIYQPVSYPILKFYGLAEDPWGRREAKIVNFNGKKVGTLR